MTEQQRVMNEGLIGMRFLLTFSKPEEGGSCNGVETLCNGLTNQIITEKILKVTEVSPNKYVCRSNENVYLVDVLAV